MLATGQQGEVAVALPGLPAIFVVKDGLSVSYSGRPLLEAFLITIDDGAVVLDRRRTGFETLRIPALDDLFAVGRRRLQQEEHACDPDDRQGRLHVHLHLFPPYPFSPLSEAHSLPADMEILQPSLMNQGFQEHFVVELMPWVKGEPVAHRLEITRAEIREAAKGSCCVLGQWTGSERAQQPLIKQDIAFGFQHQETDLVAESAQRSLVQVRKAVGSADENPAEFLHLCQEFIGEADFPRMADAIAAEQQGVRFIDDQDGLAG